MIVAKQLAKAYMLRGGQVDNRDTVTGFFFFLLFLLFSIWRAIGENGEWSNDAEHERLLCQATTTSCLLFPGQMFMAIDQPVCSLKACIHERLGNDSTWCGVGRQPRDLKFGLSFRSLKAVPYIAIRHQ